MSGPQARLASTLPQLTNRRGEHNEGGNGEMFNIWVSIALLGLWSCVGVIYSNSRKASRQMDEIIQLLTRIADKK